MNKYIVIFLCYLTVIIISNLVGYFIFKAIIKKQKVEVRIKEISGAKMKKCFKCNSDMIYLGGHKGPIGIGQIYNYVCTNCHQVEWSTAKEKSKYKWYKFDKNELKKILELEEGVK